MKGLGFDFNVGNMLKNYINDVLNNYMAKTGAFLQFPQVLSQLKDRTTRLSQISGYYTQSATLMLDITNAQAVQSSAQMQGLNIINVVDEIKRNPLVVDAMKGKYPQVYEIDKWQRLTDFANKVNDAKNQLSVFFDLVDRQQNTVDGITARVGTLEAQAGITPKQALTLASVPVGVWIGVGFLGLKLLGGFVYRKFSGRKRR